MWTFRKSFQPAMWILSFVNGMYLTRVFFEEPKGWFRLEAREWITFVRSIIVPRHTAYGLEVLTTAYVQKKLVQIHWLLEVLFKYCFFLILQECIILSILLKLNTYMQKKPWHDLWKVQKRMLKRKVDWFYHDIASTNLSFLTKICSHSTKTYTESRTWTE